MSRLNAAICGHFINAMSFAMLMAGRLSGVSKWVALVGIACIVVAAAIAHFVESEDASGNVPWFETQSEADTYYAGDYARRARWYNVCAVLVAAAVLLGLFSIWSL